LVDTAVDTPGPSYARVQTISALPASLDALHIRRGRPVLVSVGGASGMDSQHLSAVARLLYKHVVPLLDHAEVTVVDGGTDVGVMRVMGQARQDSHARFPLIGVAAENTIVLPGGMRGTVDAAHFEPHHTHLVLVPGDSWGDESPWLSHVATVIAGDQPSATLVINGGEVTYDDIALSLEHNRPVVVLAGTGRTADAIAAASAGQEHDPRALELAASPLTHVIHIRDGKKLTAALESLLKRPPHRRPVTLGQDA
jgi:SLOG in TRPM, prokaryote